MPSLSGEFFSSSHHRMHVNDHLDQATTTHHAGNREHEGVVLRAAGSILALGSLARPSTINPQPIASRAGELRGSIHPHPFDHHPSIKASNKTGTKFLDEHDQKALLVEGHLPGTVHLPVNTNLHDPTTTSTRPTRKESYFERMKSPWDSDYRTRQADDLHDLRSERSTSAPPPETSFLFGRNDGLVAPTASYFGGIDSGSEEKWNTPFDRRDRGGAGINSLFMDSSNGHGRACVPASFDKPPPGFSRSGGLGGGDTLSSSIPRSMDFGNGSRLGSMDMMDRRSIGENLIRSHSAAPSFDGRLSMGPPPGLANSETPLVSNQTARDSYLEPAMDTSRILQLGQRRPASTGVIGGTQNSSSDVLRSLGLGPLGSASGGAVRPAAKTLMDLIQEDFPPESPGDLNRYSAYPRDEIYVERPRTTSPLSLQTRDYMYDDHSGGRNNSGLSDALDRLRIDQRDEYRPTEQQRPSPQYIAMRHSNGDGQPPNAIYAPALVPQAARPQPQMIQQQAQYDHHHQQQQQQQQHQHHQQPPQQGYRGQPPHIQTHVQTHVLPNGQTVYLNALPPQYGYAQVQYQQHQIVHQLPAGIGPNGEQQYISVVPIQGGAPAPGGGPGPSYAYYDANGQPGGTPAYTIVSSHNQQPLTPTPGGSPMGANRGSNGNVDPHRQNQSGGRGKEKGGRGRRGGANNSRRSGGGGSTEQKVQPNAVSSPLLETFKAKKNRDWTVVDIKGHVVEFCQDQNGSRFIQQRLEIGSSAEKEIVMAEALPAVRRLRNDVFGNYVVQKLLDFGTLKMKEDLRETLQGEMLQLSLQMYGCRVVQKALEALDDADVPKLLKEFHNNVLSCIHDQNGNHVIQKSIEVMCEKSKTARERGDNVQADFFDDQIDFILDDVLNNVPSLSCHPYGCRVLQRILEHCPEPRKTNTLDEIKKCHRTLLDDQYGNYVIQHVLQFGRSCDRDSLLDIVIENGLLILSRQKFASNVVEKLLKYGSPEQRSRIVKEMLKMVNDVTGEQVPEGVEGTSVVLLMVRDAYANYVVQTTLDVVADETEKQKLMEELNSHSTELKNYTFAKHIVTKLENWSRGAAP